MRPNNTNYFTSRTAHGKATILCNSVYCVCDRRIISLDVCFYGASAQTNMKESACRIKMILYYFQE